MRIISVFEYRHLRGTDGIWWENFASNSSVGLKVLDPRVQFSKQVLSQKTLRQLEDVLLMLTDCLHY